MLTNWFHRILLCSLPLVSFLFLFFKPDSSVLIVSFSIPLLALLCLILGYFKLRQNQPFYYNGITFVLLAYTLWLFLSLFWTTIPNFGSLMVWLFLALPVGFCLSLLLIKKNSDWYEMFGMITLLICIMSVWAIYQYWILGIPPHANLNDKNLLATLITAFTLALSAYYLQLKMIARHSLAKWILVTICLLSLGSATLYARVATFSFIVLFLFVCILLWKHLKFKMLWPLVLGIILSYGLPTTITRMHYTIYNNPIQKLFNFDIQKPVSQYINLGSDAGQSWHDRIQLWKDTVILIQQHPFLGSGLATFAYEYAHLRPSADNTAGLFTHNDFLQIWDEEGLPAILLLFGLPVVIFYYLILMLRRKIASSVLVEAFFLWAGAVAVYMNALFSFDLYYPATILFVGMFLGRLQYLLGQEKIAGFSVSFKKLVKPAVLLAGFSILALILIYYLFTLFFGYITLQNITDAARQNNRAAVLDYAETLQKIRPRLEIGYLAAAETKSIYASQTNLPLPQRKLFYQFALQDLDKAQQNHRWDPKVPTLRANLLMNSQDWLGASADELIRHNMKEALFLDPRSYQSRTRYAQYLLSKQDNKAAKDILVEGLQYPYSLYKINPSDLINYYQLTLNVLQAVNGDPKQIKQTQDALARLQPRKV